MRHTIVRDTGVSRKKIVINAAPAKEWQFRQGHVRTGILRPSIPRCVLQPFRSHSPGMITGESGMKIFLTGATGYIGGSVAARFVSDGHTVRGLARSESRAAALRGLGIEPVIGSLDDTALLAAEAASADAVVNAASADHRPAAEAILTALAGSDKTFLHTSGSSIVGNRARGAARDEVYDETTPLTPAPNRAARVALNRDILAGAANGVRAVVLCPALIYGLGHGLEPHSMQVPWLIALARKDGVAKHAGPRGQYLVECPYRRPDRALPAGAGKGAGGRILFCRKRREFDARGLRGDRADARPCGRSAGHDDGGSGGRVGRRSGQ